MSFVQTNANNATTDVKLEAATLNAPYNRLASLLVSECT